jgi:DNA-binding transcriptional ArsR family regulator
VSFVVAGQVWQIPLPTSMKLVLVVLANHAHDDGTGAFPGIERIGFLTGLAERTVQQQLRALEERGLIVAVKYRTGGRGKATEYAIPMPVAPDAKGAGDAPIIQRVHLTAVKGAARAPQSVSNQGDTSEHVSPAAGSCQRAGCGRGAGHPGPHQDPWVDMIASLLYGGGPIPKHAASRVGELAKRVREYGDPPEKIRDAATWMIATWGKPGVLTLNALREHYELANNAEQSRRQLAKPTVVRVVHSHVWEPHFKDPGLEVCECGERRQHET